MTDRVGRTVSSFLSVVQPKPCCTICRKHSEESS